MEIEFVALKEDDLPTYGAPVLIKVGGVVQHLVYTLDASEDESVKWFEPYYFGHNDELKIPLYLVDEWAALPDWEP